MNLAIQLDGESGAGNRPQPCRFPCHAGGARQHPFVLWSFSTYGRKAGLIEERVLPAPAVSVS